jgi:hypothetical protein
MKNKTKISISIFAIAIGSILTTEYSSHANGNAAGAPAARTGSPKDNATCGGSLGCHGTAAYPSVSAPTITVAGLITSNIPAGGYTPGNTYTITGTVTGAGHTKFGFEISPQNSTGILGTLTNTSPSTQIVSSGYVTHTSSGTTGTTGSHTWSFDWTAPAAGTGNVTFYGIFMLTNNNSNQDVGDSLQKSTLLVHEFGTGIDDLKNISNHISIYPNPISNQFFVNNSLNETENMTVNISDINGKLVQKIQNVNGSKSSINIDDLAKGFYFLRIETSRGDVVKKIIKE